MLTCVLPLSEILVDFNDKLKSMTRGYGSMDYEHAGYRAAKMVKMDMLIAGDPVEAFSTIVHRDKAESYGLASRAATNEGGRETGRRSRCCKMHPPDRLFSPLEGSSLTVWPSTGRAKKRDGWPETGERWRQRRLSRRGTASARRHAGKRKKD
jgi:hypothetical protein